MVDLKKVYKAATKSQAEMELLNLEEIWGKKTTFDTDCVTGN